MMGKTEGHDEGSEGDGRRSIARTILKNVEKF